VATQQHHTSKKSLSSSSTHPPPECADDVGDASNGLLSRFTGASVEVLAAAAAAADDADTAVAVEEEDIPAAAPEDSRMAFEDADNFRDENDDNDGESLGEEEEVEDLRASWRYLRRLTFKPDSSSVICTWERGKPQRKERMEFDQNN